MLHLCECKDMHTQYWDFFFNLSHHLGFDLPEHKPVFLATRCHSCKKMAPEEVIGIFSIAWRCLYAELTKSRLENHIFSAKDAKRRAVCMIHSRLTAYMDGSGPGTCTTTKNSVLPVNGASYKGSTWLPGGPWPPHPRGQLSCAIGSRLNH